MNKVILVEPASRFTHVFSKFKIPRLGCILLGTAAKELGKEVRVYIEDIHPVDIQDLLTADLVGISIITPTANQGYALADRLRNSGVSVVIGGIHATFMAEEALLHADFLLRGEADESWARFLECLENNGDLKDVAGLSYWEDGEPRHNPLSGIPGMETVQSIPDFSLVVGMENVPILAFNTRRGCPFTCDFCTVRKFNGSKIRCHSVEYVRELFLLAKRRGAKYIFFNDDIFNLPEAYTYQICEEAARIIPEIPKGGQFRLEVAYNPELLVLLKKAGFRNLCIGFESFETQVLEKMHKKTTNGDVTGSIRNIVEAGFNIHGMFVAGADGDTLENIRRIPATAKKLGISSIQIMVETPLPGSDLLQRRKEEGRKILTDWDWYEGHHVVCEPSGDITPFDLNREVMEAMRRFYSLGGVVDALRRGKINQMFMRKMGWSLVKEWWRDTRNLDFLEKLKTGNW